MISQADIQALKDYVKGPSSQSQADSTVRLQITHSNLKAHFLEVRLDLQLDMLHRCILHVIDTDVNSKSAAGWLEDTSKVQKYVMSDEDYAKRENTYKQYKIMKQQEDPEWSAEKELCMRKGIPYNPPKKGAKIEDDDYMAAEAAELTTSSRCQIDPGNKRGCIRYVGRCAGLPKGFWVGVEYDEPVGKNDGSVKGKSYFSCSQGYGSFVRPDLVKAGDFPPVEVSFSDEDEI